MSSEITALVADDSSIMRRIVKNALAKCGFNNVEEAPDGAEALAKCQEQQFGCILTDWNMPNMDGLTFVQNLRKLPGYGKVPVIMITTEGGKKDVIEALTHGVNDYIVKPFEPDILKEKLDKLLG